MGLLSFLEQYCPELIKKHQKLWLFICAIVFIVPVMVGVVNVMVVKPKDVSISNLNTEISNLRAQVNSCEQQLIPFKTIALQKFSNLPESEALGYLATRIGQLELNMITLLDYQEISMWDMFGVIEKGSRGARSILIGDPSIIVGWNKGYWTISKDGEIKDIRCDQDAINRYLQTIDKAPLYPFPYYSIAICLQRQNSQQWKLYIQKTFEILSKTTAIPNHHPHHDWLMRYVVKMKNKI